MSLEQVPVPMKYNACLAPDKTWAFRCAFIAVEARAVLSTFGHGRQVSTKDLIEMLYPEHLARGTESVVARRSIGRLLRALAVGELADCARRGDLHRVRGKDVQLWRWGCPQTSDGLPVYNDSYRAAPAAPVDRAETILQFIRELREQSEHDLQDHSLSFHRGYDLALTDVLRKFKD